jgi:hypothetical protein
MVAPGLLQNPEVRRWLNGIEPAWTMLEFNSFNALLDEPSASNGAIRLEANLPDLELSGSAIVANALILLRRSRRHGWAEADRHRQPVPRCGRGDVRDHAMAGVRQRRTVRFSQGHLIDTRSIRGLRMRLALCSGRSRHRHRRARLPAAAFHSRPDPSREALPNVSRKAGGDAFG